MRTLERAGVTRGTGGQALPPVLAPMEQAGVSIRLGEITMIAGQPGVGKSSLALFLALRSNVPTLYFCADTAAPTMAMRLLAMLTGHRQADAEKMIESDPGWATDQMAEARHIKWCFDSAPTLGDIDDELAAYRTIMGDDPELIVIDNLIDVSDGADEWSALRATMKELKYLARDTRAALILLHHTSEATAGKPCPPRASVQGKVAQLPAVILTLAQDDKRLLISAVKNRHGPADPSGQRHTSVYFDPETMFISDGSSHAGQ